MSGTSVGATSAPLDAANAAFWDELCGTTLAQSLGIRDRSVESLARFDRAYLDFYPYLLKHVDVSRMRNKRVLEIGLGYGTLSQQIVEAGADYIGLDIAAGPVDMLNHRLRMQGFPGQAIRASVMRAPIADNSLDYVVSIGCFHHTGDVAQCIRETYRMLKLGGTAMIMVYNQFSYRQWIRWPRHTLLAALQRDGGTLRGNTAQRRAYDANSAGTAAPETVFVSVNQLRAMFRRFSRVEFCKENTDSLMLAGRTLVPRHLLLSSFGRVLGLDLYIEARK